jgi:hypothetical protein
MPEATTSDTAQIFPILVGYVCVIMFLLVTALAADMWDHLNSSRQFTVFEAFCFWMGAFI